MKSLLSWCAAFAAIVCIGRTVMAQETWVGNADANWSTSGNWTPNPTLTAGDALIFGAVNNAGTTTLTNDTLANTSYAGITFDALSAAYTLNGNAITLTGGITNNAAAAEALNFNIATTAVRTVSTINGGSVVLGGIISGAAGGFNLTGNGTVTLGLAGGAVNSNTGVTTLNSGVTLNINKSGAIGANAATLLINGGTIDNTSGAAITTSANVVTYAGDFTFTGTNNLTFGNGTSSLGTGGTNRTFNIVAGTLTTSNNAMSGVGIGITKTGAGTLVMGSSANTFSGPFIIEGGLVKVGSYNGAFGSATSTDAANLVIAGGGVTSGATSPITTDRLFTIGNANGLTAYIENTASTSGNTVTFTNTGALAYGGNGARTLTFSSLNTNNHFAPLIGNGAGGATTLVKVGVGGWFIDNGSNSYSGGTTISSGTLYIGATGTPLGTGLINFSGTSTLTWNGVATDLSANGISATSGVTGTLDVGVTNVAFGTANGLTGSGNITKSATTAGTLTLNAANNLSGIYTTSTTGGTTILNNASALGSAVVSVAGNDRLVFGTGIGTFTVGGLSGLGNVSLLDNTSPTPVAITLQVGGGNASTATSQTGIISGTNGSIVKIGTGTQILGGANTFTGGLTIKAGTISAVTSTSALGGTGGLGNVTLGDNTGNSAATLLGDGRTFSNPITVQSTTTGTLTIGNSGSSSTIFGGNITLNNALTLVGAGTGSVRLNGNITGTSAISLSSASTGAVTLGGTNTAYTGTMTLLSGRANVATTTGLGAGTFVISGGTILGNAAGSSLTASTNMTWNGDFTFFATSTDSLTLSGNVALGAPLTVTVAGNTLTVNNAVTGGNGVFDITKAGPGTLTYVANANMAGNRTLNISGGGTENFSGVLSESVVGSTLTVNGAGTVSFNNTTGSTYTGATTISGGATLSASKMAIGGLASSIGASTAVAGNLIIDNGTLNVASGGAGQATDRLFTLGAGGATLTGRNTNWTNTGALAYTGSGARTLTLDLNTGNASSLAAIIADAAVGQATSLVKSSGGRWTISNANTYSGGTTVTGGFLVVTGANQSLGTGSATVTGGGELQIANIANLNTGGGAKVLLSGTATSSAVLAVGFDFTQSQLNTILNSSSANGVVSLFADANRGQTNALDLALIGNGSLFLGGAGQAPSGAANVSTYSAGSLGVGNGNVYRLGGGYGNGVILFNGNVLANTSGGNQNNLIIGAPGGAGTVQFTSNNSAFLGTTTVNTGTLTLNGAAGGLTGSAITLNPGTSLAFDTAATGGTTRAASLNMRGGTFTVTGTSAVNTIDVITNALNINGDVAGGGVPVINLAGQTNSNAKLNVGSLTRSNNGVAIITGRALGNTPANGVTNLIVTSGAGQTALTGELKGTGDGTAQNHRIIPWLTGAVTSGGGSASFMTYDVTNGLRPLNTATEYATTISSGTVSDKNVRIGGAGGTLATIGAATTINSLWTVSSGTAQSIAGTGVLTITSGAVYLESNATTTIAAPMNFDAAQGIIQYSKGKISAISGTISGSGGLVLYQTGAPVQGSGGSGVTITGTHSYNGDTTLIGRLDLGVSTFLPNATAGRSGDLYNYGLLNVNTSVTINGLNGSGVVTRNGGSGTLTVGDGNANGSFSGVIDQSGSATAISLIKIGNGTQTLSGQNAYTGTTTVSGGKLSVAGSLGTGNVSVGTGAILELLGTSTAINDTASLSLASTALAELDFTGAEVVSSLTLNGVAQIAGTYGATGSGAQFTNDTFFSGTGVIAVPEPATLGLLAIGAMGLLTRRRRAA